MAYDDAILRQQRAASSQQSQQKQQASNVYDDAILRKQRVNKTGGATFAPRPLKFPLENQDRFKGNIQFQAIEVIPPNLSISKQLINNLTDNKQKFKEAEATRNRPPYERQTGNSQLKSSDVKVESMKLNILAGENVTMHLPLSYVVNDIINYDNTELGILGATGMQALQNTGDIASSVGQVVKSGVSGLKDMFSAGSSLSGVAARVAIARGSGFIPSQTARDVLRSAAQVTVNPNIRSIFRGVALREFTFQFKLIPNSAEESKEIKEIIRFFRKHAYPESIEKGGVPLAFIFPHMFKIKLRYDNNPIGTRIKMCYLRNITTTYNPTASSFFADGSPTEIDLSMTFVENTTITRQDIVGRNENASYEEGDARYLDQGGGF